MSKDNAGASQVTGFLLSDFLFYSPGTVSKDNFVIGNLKDYKPNIKAEKEAQTDEKTNFSH